MAMVVWKLKEFMAAHRLSPVDVERASKIGKNTIYRVIRGDGVVLVDRRTLAAILVGLRQLTGKEVNVSDLLAFDETVPNPVFERTYTDTERVRVSVDGKE